MFLQVDKDLFSMGLDAVEILVIAQVQEFERNTGDCFISNETLAKQFGISVDTIKRRLNNLEKKGLIVRDTKPTQNGKERHIKTTIPKSKLHLAEDDKNKPKSKLHLAESANCTLRKEQNAPIKDNRKDKEEKIIQTETLNSVSVIHKPKEAPKETTADKVKKAMALTGKSAEKIRADLVINYGFSDSLIEAKRAAIVDKYLDDVICAKGKI